MYPFNHQNEWKRWCFNKLDFHDKPYQQRVFCLRFGVPTMCRAQPKTQAVFCPDAVPEQPRRSLMHN